MENRKKQEKRQGNRLDRLTDAMTRYCGHCTTGAQLLCEEFGEELQQEEKSPKKGKPA